MSRRWRYPRSRRGIFYQIFTTQAAPAAPSYVPSLQEPSARNSRPRTTRRGQFFRVAPAAVVQVASFVPSVMEPAGRNSRPRVTRRGTFYSVPPASIAAVAVWVPTLLSGRRKPSRPIRRGAYQTVLPPVALAGPGPLAPNIQHPSTRRAAVARRGRFYTVPVAVVLAGPGPCPPSVQRPSTRRLTAPRRGQFLSVPKVGAAPLTPSVPTFTRPRVRGGLARRGQFFAVPLPRATCPVRMTSRRLSQPILRRGQIWRPPWVFVPPAGPGPYIPRMITHPHRPPVRPTRRGVFIEPAWPSEAHSCTTPRPDSGVTVRPTGTTTRPTAGITERPCAAT